MVTVPVSVPPPVFLTVKAERVLVWPTVTEPKLTTVVGVIVIIAPPWVGGGVSALGVDVPVEIAWQVWD